MSRRIQAGLVLAASLPLLPAQALSWQQAQTVVAPSSRSHASLAYNAATQRCVLFGGLASSSSSPADTWVWDGSTWADVSPAVGPPVREYAAMAYDAAGMRVILFGGYGATGPLNDTWAWDGVTWTQLTPANPPPPRFGMPLTYDPVRNVIVGFGGWIGGTIWTGSASTSTYEFDGTDWSEVVSPQLPPHRYHSHLYFDEARGRVRLYGGVFTPNQFPRNDVWEWDGVTWTEVTPAVVPSAVGFPAVAYCPPLHTMVRVGGVDFPFSATDEQWFLHRWWRNASNVSKPPPLNGALMAFDDARQQMVIFTGLDVWLGDIVTGASASSPFGASCSGAANLVSDLPLLNTTSSSSVLIQMVSPPSIFAFLAGGLSATSINGQPLPLDLGLLGMPDCTLLTSSELLGVPMIPAGSVASYSMSLPLDPSLVDMRLYLQGYALDPQVSPTPISTTNAIEWILGYF